MADMKQHLMVFLQKKLQLQNVEDNVGDVQHGVIINHLENTMKDLYSQIEQKSSQIESYAKVLFFSFLQLLLVDFVDAFTLKL